MHGLIAVTVGQATAGVVALALLAGVGWWAAMRWRGQTERALQAAWRMFERGQWSPALDIARRLTPVIGSAPAPWHDDRRRLEGACLAAAADAALAAGHFDEALRLALESARCLDQPTEAAQRRVLDAMIEKIRRLSVATPDSGELRDLIDGVLRLDPQQAEAAFWLGLDCLRRDNHPGAVESLTMAVGSEGNRAADAALYLGATHLHGGRPRDAVRVLAPAYAVAPNCPLIAWQLGAALIAAHGDLVLAVRALQKAIGPDGFPRYLRDANRLWTESLPRESWLRRAVEHARSQPFRCPLKFHHVRSNWMAAQRSLAEALILTRKPSEAVPILADLLRDKDEPALRRGLGLALAAADRSDEALPILRRVLSETASPDGELLAAMVQSCVRSSGDRQSHLSEALRLVEAHPRFDDPNWVQRAAEAVTAAHNAGIAPPIGLLRQLAAKLVAGDAADPAAAGAYNLLAVQDRDRLSFEIAALYLRAAERHGVRLEADEILLDRAFQDRERLAAMFQAHGWDFAAAERLYLERWAERNPGTVPTAPGPGYADQAVAALIAESRRYERIRQWDAARKTLDLALTLAPSSSAVFDRLAEVAFRRDQVEEAVDWLDRWVREDGKNPLAWLRLALVEQARGNDIGAETAMQTALDAARGGERSVVLFAAARVALAAGRRDDARRMLAEAVTLDPANAKVRATAAALAWDTGDSHEFARLAEPLASDGADDPTLRLIAAAGAVAAGNDAIAEDRIRHLLDSPLAGDGHHLIALLARRRGANQEVIRAADAAAAAGTGLTREHAEALRGEAAWSAGDFAGALRAWRSISAANLKAWGLDRVAPGAAILAGIQAFRQDSADESAKWLRAALRFGSDDPRLKSLLVVATLHAAARLDPAKAEHRLEQAIEAAGPLTALAIPLARRYRLAGRLDEAMQLLDRVEQRAPEWLAERGLLHRARQELVLAERAFAEAAQADAVPPAVMVNLLFTRLSLGRVPEAIAVLPQAKRATADPRRRRTLELFRALSFGGAPLVDSWSAEDEKLFADFIQQIGRLESVEGVIELWSKARPASAAVRRLQSELAPLRAKRLIDQGDAEAVLRRYGSLAAVAPPILRNLLGIAAALRQDFAGARRHFTAALVRPDDARVHQNLAIVCEWAGDSQAAADHWRQCLATHAAQMSKPPGLPHYHRRIAALIEERIRRLEDAAE